MLTTNGAATHPAPYAMIDNENSLLGSSDLVFVDAVGTGFSRIVGHATGKDFYGVDEDGKAFAQFIRRYITTNDRWNSPKYLAGESYGTTRSCVLANRLQDDGISLSGVVLISSVLDFATVFPQTGDDEPYWLYLPTEAAVASYHHKIAEPGDMHAFLATVRAYARGPYAQALAVGDALPAAERAAIARQLSAIYGPPGRLSPTVELARSAGALRESAARRYRTHDRSLRRALLELRHRSDRRRSRYGSILGRALRCIYGVVQQLRPETSWGTRRMRSTSF